MKKLTKLFLSLVLVFPLSAISYENGTKGKVKHLEVQDGAVILKLSNTHKLVNNCGSIEYLTLEPKNKNGLDNPLFNQMYSMLLAAQMSDKDVNVLTQECGTFNSKFQEVLRVKIVIE